MDHRRPPHALTNFLPPNGSVKMGDVPHPDFSKTEKTKIRIDGIRAPKALERDHQHSPFRKDFPHISKSSARDRRQCEEKSSGLINIIVMSSCSDDSRTHSSETSRSTLVIEKYTCFVIRLTGKCVYALGKFWAISTALPHPHPQKCQHYKVL